MLPMLPPPLLLEPIDTNVRALFAALDTAPPCENIFALPPPSFVLPPSAPPMLPPPPTLLLPPLETNRQILDHLLLCQRETLLLAQLANEILAEQTRRANENASLVRLRATNIAATAIGSLCF